MANQPKKYKKFVATAATATLVASAIVPVASAAFTDVAATDSHKANISMVRYRWLPRRHFQASAGR